MYNKEGELNNKDLIKALKELHSQVSNTMDTYDILKNYIIYKAKSRQEKKEGIKTSKGTIHNNTEFAKAFDVSTTTLYNWSNNSNFTHVLLKFQNASKETRLIEIKNRLFDLAMTGQAKDIELYLKYEEGYRPTSEVYTGDITGSDIDAGLKKHNSTYKAGDHAKQSNSIMVTDNESSHIVKGGEGH